MLEFYKGKRVFITGHTGFKGAWLSLLLLEAGAEVTGYALQPKQETNLFNLLKLNESMRSYFCDVRNYEALSKAIEDSKPDIVLHLAAQPIVSEGYQAPRLTYETNVMGTVNLLESVRQSSCVQSVLNVTTDKVYQNREWIWGYRENESLDGYDPYSNSKSCSELVTHTYSRCFFQSGSAISTARAGNVIGGGDFALNRIIPDCVRAVQRGEPIIVRNPSSVRPYQHVFEPLYAYLLLAQRQFEDASVAGSFNVGPNEEGCICTSELATLFCEAWGEGVCWENRGVEGPHEAQFLRLDSSKIRSMFGWRPRMDIQKSVSTTVDWFHAYVRGENMQSISLAQIRAYDAIQG